ncbi:MAG: M55 family metallopeptidase [Anaerolineales bacterium]|nr:M55 family metallopeptidase [Anaerolineales bacterium]
MKVFISADIEGVTGFPSMASYAVLVDRLYLFNDPHC